MNRAKTARMNQAAFLNSLDRSQSDNIADHTCVMYVFKISNAYWSKSDLKINYNADQA